MHTGRTTGPPSSGFAGGLLVLSGCLLLNTALGPLGAGAVDYPISTSMENQLRGLELVTVLLVVPWLVATALLARGGHPAAPLLAIGPAGYAPYSGPRTYCTNMYDA